MDSLVLHTRVVSGAGGGPEKTILNSPRFLEDRGYPMVCAYMRDPRDAAFEALRERAEGKGVELVAIDDNGPLDWRLIGRFRQLCERYRPAIWHAHDYKSNFLGLLVRRYVPMKLVTTVHGWVQRTWKTPLYYAIDHRCLPRYDGVICVSEDLYETCRRLAVPAERCWYVPNAIDTDEFRRRQTLPAAKEGAGVGESKLVVGAMGRLSDEKGFHLLIEAFGALRANGVEAELWIAGAGPEEARLKRLARELGLAEHVKILGFVTDTIGFFETLDVFVLSSIREGLPNVVLEAMALEVPVLCTRVAGVPALVREGDNGLVIEPGDVGALERGMARLLKDAPLRGSLGAAGRATVVASHSFRLRMERIKSIYDQVLGVVREGCAGQP